MIGRPTLIRLSWILTAAAAILFAGTIVLDTVRAVAPLWSPLPWFDEWATVALIRDWQDGDRTAAQVLFAQHNEHRILVPRLVFFADDLLFRGGGRLSLACIFAVQALHAGVFAAVLGRSRPRHAGRWAVAAVVLAMMFSLRQEENFSSGFQLQFVAVFAGATLSFALFGLAAGRARSRRPLAAPLVASFGAALLTALTMANGLAVGYVLVALGLAARMRLRIVLACAAWVALLTVVYLQGYEPVGHHSRPSESLRHPLDLLLYVATYLGSLISASPDGWASGLGFVGLIATGCAAWRSLRRAGARPGALAMVGVMLFVVVTAAVTGSGRLEFGVGQALSSRYVTGSVAFWAAQLSYWWVDPPAVSLRIGPWSPPAGALGRGAVAVAAAALCIPVAGHQAGAKPQLAAQSFAQNEAANLLMLGLDDPAAIARTAWTDEDAERLAPTLRDDGLSVFGTADFAALGHPVAERGTVGPPCGGVVASAVADPTLGAGGVRVSGRAADGRRVVRRVLLADAEGRVAGFASGAIPGAARDAWRGFAVAPAGTALTAYGLVDRARLCRIGTASVAPAAQASQPLAAP